LSHGWRVSRFQLGGRYRAGHHIQCIGHGGDSLAGCKRGERSIAVRAHTDFQPVVRDVENAGAIIERDGEEATTLPVTFVLNNENVRSKLPLAGEPPLMSCP